MEILNLFPGLFLIIGVSVWFAACGGSSDWGYSKAMYFSGGWSVWLKNGYEGN